MSEHKHDCTVEGQHYTCVCDCGWLWPNPEEPAVAPRKAEAPSEERLTKEELAKIRKMLAPYRDEVAAKRLLVELDVVTRERDEAAQDRDDAHRQLENFAGDAQKIAELTAELEQARLGMTYPEWKASVEEAEQRGYERGVEAALTSAKAGLRSWADDVNDERTVDAVVDDAIRQLKAKEQP